MGKVDTKNAGRPTRHQRDRLRSSRAAHFRKQMPDAARRHVYIRNACTRFCPGDAIGPEKHEVNGIVRCHVDTARVRALFLRALWL